MGFGAAFALALSAAGSSTAPLNTLQELFRAFDSCWVPPPHEQAVEGMEITVRFSLTREGKILGEPRFTFVTPNVAPAARVAYQRAVAETLIRCTPMSLTPGLAGAITGRPISWRLIDRRPQIKI